MPNLAEELEHLDQADRHIELARGNLSTVQRSAPQGDQRHDKEAAERLATLKAALAAFEAHRALIVKTIEGIRNGSLPGAGDETAVQGVRPA
jgi:hypothetical protein